MANPKPAAKKPRTPPTPAASTIQRPSAVRSFALTEEDLGALQQLCQDASDYTGRTVSSSRLVRAMIRHAASQPPRWAREMLCPLIESEIAAGVQWGRESTKAFTER